MTHHCKIDNPATYDPLKNKFGCHWVNLYMFRHHLSIRRKTNKKKTSVFQRLHKIKNYHYFCVYMLADCSISDTESESSETEESEEETSSDSSSKDEGEVTTDDSDSESS